MAMERIKKYVRDNQGTGYRVETGFWSVTTDVKVNAEKKQTKVLCQLLSRGYVCWGLP